MTQVDDAAMVISLASDVIRLIRSRQAVLDAGNVFTSPADPEITFTLTAAQLKAKYSDVIDAKWNAIEVLAARN